MLEDKFGAESKHINTGNMTIFNLDKLLKIQRSYDTEIIIKTRRKNVLESDGECSEGSEGSRDQASASEGGKTIEDLNNGNGKDEDISRNEGSEGYPICPAVSQVPSQPSQPSLPNPSNEETYLCYHNGCGFQTQDEYEYKRHGAAKHVKNPLLYPSKAELNKYSLQAQGKSWEI